LLEIKTTTHLLPRKSLRPRRLRRLRFGKQLRLRRPRFRKRLRLRRLRFRKQLRLKRE